jgi:hypothetical protein
VRLELQFLLGQLEFTVERISPFLSLTHVRPPILARSGCVHFSLTLPWGFLPMRTRNPGCSCTSHRCCQHPLHLPQSRIRATRRDARQACNLWMILALCGRVITMSVLCEVNPFGKAIIALPYIASSLLLNAHLSPIEGQVVLIYLVDIVLKCT